MGIAGLVNMAMVAMAATMFHDGHADVGEIESAYHTLLPLMGVAAGAAFMASLRDGPAAGQQVPAKAVA